MIHRQNLNILSQLRPGQILTCDSTLTIRHNIGVGATWHNPPESLPVAINNSFQHYFKLFEIVASPDFTLTENAEYPNLKVSLTGIVTLAETYKNNNMNETLVGELIRLYTNLRNQYDHLLYRYPDFFNKYIEKTVTIEECETALKDIEQNLEMIISQSEHPDRDEAQKLKKYVGVLKETLQNCYETLTEKAQSLFKLIVQFFIKLTKPEETKPDTTIRSVISMKLARTATSMSNETETTQNTQNEPTGESQEMDEDQVRVEQLKNDIDFINDTDYIKVNVDEESRVDA